MWKEVQRTRKKAVLSRHFGMFSHVSHSRQSVSKSIGVFNVKQCMDDKGKVFYGQEPPSGESTTTE